MVFKKGISKGYKFFSDDEAKLILETYLNKTNGKFIQKVEITNVKCFKNGVIRYSYLNKKPKRRETTITSLNKIYQYLKNELKLELLIA